jgi:hypothetical protein
LIAIAGNVADEAVAALAAGHAQAAGTFSGWINNAAVFRDASIHSAPTYETFLSQTECFINISPSTH